MQKTLTEDLVNADKIAAGMINDSLPSAYALNYNYGTYEVEHGAEIDTSFSLYDHATVENLMKKDPKIIPQARVDIPKDELWNRRKLTSAITQGILQGESIPKIAKRLGSVADMDRKAAIRNARTYTTAAENKGRIDSYDRAEQMGIKVKKKWMATLDDRTRVEHRHLDGQVRDNDEPFETDGYEIMFPGDPSAEPEMIYNCRCTLVAEIEGYQYQDERNDSKLGDMTYEEWKHAKDKPGKDGSTKQDAEIRAEKEKVSVDFGNVSEVIGESRKVASEEYAERMGAEDVDKFNAILRKAEYVENDNGSYYDPETNKIFISNNPDDFMKGTTVFHESTHWFDFNQDYTITEDYGRFHWIIDENGDATGEKEWIPDITTIKEHAGFSEYIAWQWDKDIFDHEKHEWIDSGQKLDMRNFVAKVGTSDTYGPERKPEDVEKDFRAIRNYLEEKGISISDPDFEHLSDFISAISYDSNLGSLVTGGHSYSYWTKGHSNRVTEITAGYNLLKSTGREDLIEIERDLAPNLMKLIESEWAKIW